MLCVFTEEALNDVQLDCCIFLSGDEMDNKILDEVFDWIAVFA